MDNQKLLGRWRLMLGSEAEQTINRLGGCTLSEEDLLTDTALAQIYGGGAEGVTEFSGRSGGHGASSPKLTKWLGDLRKLFSPMEVKVIQNDAINRKGLKQLLFEPETIETMVPDVSTASLLLMLKDQIPAKAKDNARMYIRAIVEDINRRLADDLKRSVTAALNRRAHSPIPSAAALDYKMTIRRNLRHYNTEMHTILPEKFYFFERAAKSGSRTVILDIDQSGSMAESAIYASVIGCILASIRALKTHIVAFDTTVTDLTALCEDPVDLLYGIQLGGGTDIDKSVTYCRTLIEEPQKTTLFLVTDLCEGGNRAHLEKQLAELKESGVKVTVLLAISDSGAPYYDSQLAQRLASYDIPCFACPPEKLPDMLEAALRGKKFEAERRKAGNC